MKTATNPHYSEFDLQMKLHYIKGVKSGYPYDHPELKKIEEYENELKEQKAA